MHGLVRQLVVSRVRWGLLMTPMACSPTDPPPPTSCSHRLGRTLLVDDSCTRVARDAFGGSARLVASKINHAEGECLAIPLRDGGFAIGVVARANATGVLLGYFFGPRRDVVPELK